MEVYFLTINKIQSSQFRFGQKEELAGYIWTASPRITANGCLPGMLLKTYDRMSEERKKEIEEIAVGNMK